MPMIGYRAEWCRYTLDFTFEARTSRGSMLHKDTYFIRITAPDKRVGVGEVPLFRGLSQEDTPEFEQILADKCKSITDAIEDPRVSSIAFGISSALASMSRPVLQPHRVRRGNSATGAYPKTGSCGGRTAL